MSLSIPSVHLVTDSEKEKRPVVPDQRLSPWMIWGYLVGGVLLLAAVGTWLVWFSLHLQRELDDRAIRAACERTMPEKVERCVDTVVLQRGGGKR
ncbi:MAG: hypothetical protein NNA22_06845 [Nitrospira sp.]|nr:hypothetical protein [Nitrospira sp.]